MKFVSSFLNGNVTLMMCAIMAASFGTTHAQLTSELGILDLNANGGINPATGVAWQAGDTYRFIFATSTGRDATSANIADYNSFVQNAANASTLGGAGTLGSITWKALASTETVAANVNTGTDSGTGESFWLLDGTSLVADNYADLYGSNTHSSVINVSETGETPFDGGDFTSVWTGSDGAGNIKVNAGGGNPGWLGNTVDPGDGIPKAHTGLWNFTSGAHWIDRFQVDLTDVKGLYGVSQVLTVQGTVETDPPTLLSIEDDKLSGPIEDSETVLYTVTFSEAINPSTIEATDFENAGSPAATVNSVTATGDPAVFEVSVSPGGAGTLQLQIKMGALIEDLVGNELVTTTALPDDTTITVSADTTAPTLLSFTNNVGGGPIFETGSVTYTLTFSEAMNASTIEVADFESIGSPTATISSVSSTGDPAAFEVVVSPSGVGTIQLQIKSGASLEDLASNPLDASSPIPDPTIITVNMLPEGGQLGILDMDLANGGVNPTTGNPWQPGDQYRFIFASSTGRDAASGNIADYNTFIQDLANASPLGLGSVTWSAFVSTETVAARDNTATNIAVEGTGVPILLLDGESLVADDYVDLYGSDTHSNPINISETGGTPFDGGDFTSVWTGSDGAGDIKTNAGGGNPGWLGNTVDPGDGIPKAHTGLWNFTSGAHWIDRFQVDLTDIKGVYGISEVLTISGTITGDEYATWIAGFDVGGLDGFNDDSDGDDLGNGLENFFGTDPSVFNAGLTLASGGGGMASFSHPQSATPASDITGAIYQWSTDLQTWYGDGEADGSGTTVAFTALEDDPVEGTTTVSVDVTSGPVPTKLFLRVSVDLIVPPPPLLDVDFESDNGGFSQTVAAGTAWAWGPPMSSDNGGTPNLGGSVTEGNGGSANAWGTNLGNPGYYADPTTDSCLRSPDIDLTGVTAAELTFAEALDVEASDTAVLKLINADGDVDLGTIYTAVDGDANNANWAAANGGAAIDLSTGLGLTVYLQWCLSGVGGASDDYMGWYIDDVLVTGTPAP